MKSFVEKISEFTCLLHRYEIIITHLLHRCVIIIIYLLHRYVIMIVFLSHRYMFACVIHSSQTCTYVYIHECIRWKNITDHWINMGLNLYLLY